MEYIFLIAAGAAAIHAITYGYWLKQNGNKVGAAGVFIITVLALAIPVYRMMIAP
jgi:hypothetical protein